MLDCILCCLAHDTADAAADYEADDAEDNSNNHANDCPSGARGLATAEAIDGASELTIRHWNHPVGPVILQLESCARK